MENGKCFEGERERVRDRQTDRERGREEEGEKRREIDKYITEVTFSMLAMKWIQTQKNKDRQREIK